MFYPGSGPLESYRQNRNARTHQIQKFHGCEIMPPPNRKEYKTHLYANRVCGASVNTTASLHDSVALNDPVALQDDKNSVALYDPVALHYPVALNDPVALQDEIKRLLQYIQTRRVANEANSKYYQKIMDQQQNVNKEQARTIDGLQTLVDRLQTQISELNSQNRILRNQMEKNQQDVSMGNRKGGGVKVSRFVVE